MVIRTHAHLEVALENRILFEVNLDAGGSGLYPIYPHETAIELMGYVSFRNKLEIAKDFKDGIPFKVFKKVNSYRNKFAHPKGIDLRKKFNYNTTKGKINIRNLLRCLVQSEREMDNYVKKFIY